MENKALRFLLSFLASFFLFANIETVQGQSAYHEKWKTDRLVELTSENGWLNLKGLYWLDSSLAFLNVYSKDSLTLSEVPNRKNIGQFEIQSDSVWFVPGPKFSTKSGSAEKVLQYPVENYSKGGVYFGRWKWTVIKRGDRFAVRLRDLEHPALSSFGPVPVYAYDSTWKIPAFFEPKFNQFISITNVLGQVVEWRVMGIIKFVYQGHAVELITLEDEGKLWVIFSDDSNGKETYPSGRYLYISYPDAKGNTFVDFNFSYNPPCAFTAFATCPIPPKENRLIFPVFAGEKYDFTSDH